MMRLAVARSSFSTNLHHAKKPMRVSLTGASGAIGYAALFRIASGALLGHDQPIELRLLELPQALPSLQGVVMELHDGAFPLVTSITATDVPEVAFEGANVALLVGAKPRGPGMERSDLLRENGRIFTGQGKALNQAADRSNLKVVVVGNPANTNAWIASKSAPDIDPRCFTAMTRLDHNRGLAQLAQRLKVSVADIHKFAIWGNHSSTQYPDVTHATLSNGKSVQTAINDQKWIENEFIPTVQKRGAAIIKARGASSAASAASAAIDHIRDWTLGNKEWTSIAFPSDGSYGTTKGLFYSFPVVCANGKYEMVKDLKIDAFSRARLDATDRELIEERDAVIKELNL